MTTRFELGWTDPRGMFTYAATKPELRLRQVGRMWSIVRVGVHQQYGSEIVASDMTREEAEAMLKLIEATETN